MSDQDKIPDIEIPESALNAMQEAQESYRRLAENIQSIVPQLPKIDLPRFELPENIGLRDFPAIMSPDVIREQNSWERHKEMLDIQNGLLGVQSELLKEQKSTSTLTKWIFALTILSTTIAAASLIVAICK